MRRKPTAGSGRLPPALQHPRNPQGPPARPLPLPGPAWEYLESEEYRATYGDKPVWHGYRCSHKGSVPPQRTRKACLRRGSHVGNPCPICRDRNLLVDFRNVKLLDQFICPHSGVIFHPIHTGICMKQHKRLSQAIAQAQDHGLLWLHVPFVPVPDEDFSNQHAAVGKTPPAPALKGPGQAWYPWYECSSPLPPRWPGCAAFTGDSSRRITPIPPKPIGGIKRSKILPQNSSFSLSGKLRHGAKMAAEPQNGGV
ncbi:28S ribosomal protein S18b, mitochondrial [Corvus hawaiiensis]|uniref:28S ribosomal protein S18b, mitochondrial n=1 Tax=Corvus hawaiiensis TaxID=134902 RepID=UPI00201A1E04|nr:28S ribosomal protein S18b, mitochondrial [Corvus hawaiiensis]